MILFLGLNTWDRYATIYGKKMKQLAYNFFYIRSQVPEDIIRVFLLSDLLAESLKVKKDHSFYNTVLLKKPHSFYKP